MSERRKRDQYVGRLQILVVMPETASGDGKTDFSDVKQAKF